MIFILCKDPVRHQTPFQVILFDWREKKLSCREEVYASSKQQHTQWTIRHECSFTGIQPSRISVVQYCLHGKWQVQYIDNYAILTAIMRGEAYLDRGHNWELFCRDGFATFGVFE